MPAPLWWVRGSLAAEPAGHRGTQRGAEEATASRNEAVDQAGRMAHGAWRGGAGEGEGEGGVVWSGVVVLAVRVQRTESVL